MLEHRGSLFYASPHWSDYDATSTLESPKTYIPAPPPLPLPLSGGSIGPSLVLNGEGTGVPTEWWQIIPFRALLGWKGDSTGSLWDTKSASTESSNRDGFVS